MVGKGSCDSQTSASAKRQNNSEIELKKQFVIVRPICFLCSSGKRPATRQPNIVSTFYEFFCGLIIIGCHGNTKVGFTLFYGM